jgi:hypothetical protein
MAISIISSEEKTENGTITVPESCTLIVAVVDGSVNPPKIGGVSMGVIGQVEEQGIIPAISIHQYREPAIGSLSFTCDGYLVHFVYIDDGDSYRPGTIGGYNSGGVYEGNLPSDATDLVIAILHGSIGPTTLETDEVEMTYLKDTTLVKIGYVLAAGALLACLASDTGASEGYWADGGRYWVNPVYIPGWWEYRTQWVPGYWENLHPVLIPGHWSTPPPYPPVWIPEHFEYVPLWHDGFWETEPYQYHEAVDIPGHWEDYPDVWVPAGTSQISAIFCSISQTAGGEFISRPIAFQ